jgi:hypothetical protein
LLNVRAVRFVSDSEPEPGIEVVLLPGGTASELPVQISIKGNVDFGEYDWGVTTPGGTAQSPAESSFFVVGEPVISDIDPLYTEQSERWEAVALITGHGLLVPSEPLSDHKVEFLVGPDPDPGVMTRLTEKSTPEQLEVEIKAGTGSQLGVHTVRVTTPAGIVHNPPGMAFEVREPGAGEETS